MCAYASRLCTPRAHTIHYTPRTTCTPCNKHARSYVCICDAIRAYISAYIYADVYVRVQSIYIQRGAVSSCWKDYNTYHNVRCDAGGGGVCIFTITPHSIQTILLTTLQNKITKLISTIWYEL